MKKIKIIHFMADNTLKNLCNNKLDGSWTNDDHDEKTTCPKCKRKLKRGKRMFK